MSKKCPRCGSYNTEVSVGNYAKRGVIDIGRAALAAGAAAAGSVINRTTGMAGAKTVWDNTDPGPFEGYHCCNCGQDFK